MHINSRTLFVVLLSALSSALHADALKLHATFPDRITDTPQLIANVTLENTSGNVLTVFSIDTASFHFTVTPVTDDGTGKYAVTLVGTPLREPNRVLLLPGQVIHASQDVFRDYPLGLPPGTYLIQATYNAVTPDSGVWRGAVMSEPQRLVVQAANTPEYREFLRVSAAIGRADQDAIKQMLEFAEAYPHFEYTPRLVSAMLGRLHGEHAVRAADFLIREYPDTDYLTIARRAKEFAIAAQRQQAEYEQWTDYLRKETGRPENATVAAEVAHLGTIVTAKGFAAWQAFLERYPDSYFSAEARWQLVNAAENGIVPPGFTRQSLLPRLYRALVTHDPESYWGRRALRDPAVAAMLNTAQE